MILASIHNENTAVLYAYSGKPKDGWPYKMLRGHPNICTHLYMVYILRYIYVVLYI